LTLTHRPHKCSNSSPNQVVKNVVDNFIIAFTTPTSLLAEGVNKVASTNMKNLATSILNMQNQNTKNGSPKAFLNYLLYDEYMNLIPGGSGALQVKNKDGWQILETEKIRIPQNGFLRVFSSNTEATPVSINNTAVALISGQLVEEYNYYPYGLVFDQTQVAGSIKKTDYLYNGKELQHNEFSAGNGLELADYGARMYDPQIGRWTASDPLSESRDWLSPYNYCQNNPILKIDPNGASDDDYYFNKQGQLVDYVPLNQKDRIFEENENGDHSRNINGTSMNFYQNNNPDFAMVKTYIDPGTPGHTAIGMDGMTVGFFPAIHNASSIGGVSMTYDNQLTSTKFEQRYKLANIFFLKVSNADKVNIKNSLIGMMGQVDAKSSPDYYLFGRNCTTQACNALNSMNDFKFKMYHDFDGSTYNYGNVFFITPNSLNSFMKNQYENRDIGSPVKAWMNRNPYLRQVGTYVLHN
jgi:RHS repeat-associated protein